MQRACPPTTETVSNPSPIRLFASTAVAARGRTRTVIVVALISAALAGPVLAQEVAIGSNVQDLLSYARAHNPELSAMRQEAEAVAQRIESAGALPDPVLRVELMNISNYGNDAQPSLLPSGVGETKYTLMQSLPGWGKRELRRDVAAADAQQASSRTDASWVDLSARIKTTYAEYFRAVGNDRLIREVLELLQRLEQIAQVRYAGGLATQQDAVRAQLEQTAMRSELIALENEKRQQQAKLNVLLARDMAAPLAEPLSLRPLPALSALDATRLSDRTLSKNPVLQAENARLNGALKGRDLTWRNRNPDFLVGVAPSQMGSRITTWGLMFEMNIPLQQASRRAQEREAENMVGAAQARVEALTNQLRGDLASQLSALDAARRTDSLVRTQLLAQSNLSLQSALSSYENGKADFATLLDAHRQIRKARQELLKSEVEAQLRLADIERIVGEDL